MEDDKELDLQIPLVHLNGTGRDGLIALNRAAGAAIRAALEKLQNAAPNQRDYYPLEPRSPGAFQRAQREHLSRMERLQSVLAELTHLNERIHRS